MGPGYRLFISIKHFLVLLFVYNLNTIAFVDATKYASLPPVDFTLADAVRSDVTFQLFTNSNLDGTYFDEETIQNVTLNENTPTKFLIHGWLSNETTYWYQPLRDEYFKKGDHNIVYIDWSKAGSKAYHISAANSKPIGQFIGDFIMASNLKHENVHVIGHSLGSHVAGFVGKQINNRSLEQLVRITGTDPAGPMFEHEDVGEDARIAQSDAAFVDIVHTDVGYYGFGGAIGDVDFYPNGGTFQPGCPSIEEDDNCSHARSNFYFIESVHSDDFKATICTSLDDYISGNCDDEEPIVFGDNVPMNSTGIYYFATNAEPPFAMG